MEDSGGVAKAIFLESIQMEPGLGLHKSRLRDCLKGSASLRVSLVKGERGKGGGGTRARLVNWKPATAVWSRKGAFRMARKGGTLGKRRGLKRRIFLGEGTLVLLLSRLCCWDWNEKGKKVWCDISLGGWQHSLCLGVRVSKSCRW